MARGHQRRTADEVRGVAGSAELWQAAGNNGTRGIVKCDGGGYQGAWDAAT